MKKQTHVSLEHNENIRTNYTMIFYYRFVFFFIFISLIKGDGSSINFRHITVEKDGLSESTVHNIFQDSRGYIWISTDNGLNKYNGHTMKSYQYMHYDSNSISKGAPRHIFEDSEGFIWVTTDAGFINKLDPQTERFIQINPFKSSNINLKIKTINQDMFLKMLNETS